MFSPAKPSVWICQHLYVPLKASEHFRLKYWWERHSLQSNRALQDTIWSLWTKKWKKENIELKAEEYFQREMFRARNDTGWLWMAVVSLLGCFQDMLNPCKPMFNPLRDSCNKVIGHNRRRLLSFLSTGIKKNCRPVLYGCDPRFVGGLSRL